VRIYYTLAALWLGIASFLFWAAWACWGIYGGARAFGLYPNKHLLASVLFSLALAASFYGIVNAAWTRAAGFCEAA
jgi:hypothetical protein